MSVNQRIQEIIDKMYFGNKRAFSKAAGISASVTENIVGTRHTKPSFDITSKIISSFENINSEWLLTGQGNMLKSEIPSPVQNENVSEDRAGYHKPSGMLAKPFFDSPLSLTKSFTSAIKNDNIRTIIIPFIDNYDFSLRNSGDSMLNESNPRKSIKDQDIVACKFWKDKSHIRWGEVYALSTKNGYIIKKLMPSGIDDKVKCVSYNEKEGYESFDLPLSEILEWAIVTGVISINAW
ncbi:S24 family peptidase [Prevotella sp. 10(H)]|uniref:S24 family peptidase n=1 Tax=Prevotella sp. 10(H) TaxID=1158294 RepID=UPI000B212B81|nr:S24 family peptidase [Prevotella sp. 10(H)]